MTCLTAYVNNQCHGQKSVNAYQPIKQTYVNSVASENAASDLSFYCLSRVLQFTRKEAIVAVLYNMYLATKRGDAVLLKMRQINYYQSVTPQNCLESMT